MAQMQYKISSVEEMAFRIFISGYSDKILDFIKEFLDIVHECAKLGGFEKKLVENAMGKKKSDFANSNADVSNHSANNRLLFLLPHTFHNSLMEKALAKRIESDAAGTADFCPGKLLKEKILGQITSVQVLFFGNTSQKDAENFCQENIVSKFKLVENVNHACPLHIGSLYPGDTCKEKLEEELQRVMGTPTPVSIKKDIKLGQSSNPTVKKKLSESGP